MGRMLPEKAPALETVSWPDKTIKQRNTSTLKKSHRPQYTLYEAL